MTSDNVLYQSYWKMCGYRVYAVDGADNLAALVPDRPDGFDLGTRTRRVAGIFFVSDNRVPCPIPT